MFFITNLDWTFHQLDIKKTFLNRELEDVFMTLPTRFYKGYNTIYKLKESLYDLKQLTRAWFFVKVIRKQGY